VAIENAKKLVEESKKKLEDSILISPVDWVILDLSLSKWEYVWWNSIDFISIWTNNSKYIESYLEEWDIIKITDWQTVNISLDAIEWISFTWAVKYISAKWEEDSNWIITYKVIIDYSVDNKNLKDGMWVTLDFITKQVKNVVSIPVKSVLPYNWKPSVKLEDWTWKEVITWFTDSKEVEIISWLKLGDKILIKK
jgi:hypothetical protein